MIEQYSNLEQWLFSHYGMEKQALQLCEECGELIQASSKLVRHNASDDAVAAMVEEIADVIVMCRQFLLAFKVSDRELSDIIERKILRQWTRVQEERLD